MRRIKSSKLLILILFTVLVAMLLSGCEKRSVVLTTGMKSDELLRINSKSCYLPEMMLYLTTVQNRFEAVYGNGMWLQTDDDGSTLEEKVKDLVLAKVAKVKVMNLMAETYGVTLDDEEKAEVAEVSGSFFASLNDTEKNVLGITPDIVSSCYTEYALANKTYEYIIRDINPEISDDEARTVTVQQILIKTYSLDADGKRIEYSQRAKEDAENLAKEVYELAEADGESFEALAAEYNEGDNVTYSFMRGEMAPEFEEVAFSLDNGEIGGPVMTEAGYHIIKCVSDFDVQQTQKNKLEILERRKLEVFNSTYEEYIKTLNKILNKTLYESIIMIHNPDVTTSDFFDVDF